MPEIHLLVPGSGLGTCPEFGLLRTTDRRNPGKAFSSRLLRVPTRERQAAGCDMEGVAEIGQTGSQGGVSRYASPGDRSIACLWTEILFGKWVLFPKVPGIAMIRWCDLWSGKRRSRNCDCL